MSFLYGIEISKFIKPWEITLKGMGSEVFTRPDNLFGDKC